MPLATGSGSPTGPTPAGAWRRCWRAAGGRRGRDDVLVLGLPRGGVPVAAEVARAVGAPLDVLVVRKLGVPGQPELAMGAIAAVGDVVEVVHQRRGHPPAGHPAAASSGVSGRELVELRRRAPRTGASGRRRWSPARVVIIVDDGLATGSTMRAAAAAVAPRGAPPR